ncbi:MAG: STAS domain-containing protein [Proteobacteria bacterium]|nr:STAS domain-containing protein [Pseudomonadota bacterium]
MKTITAVTGSEGHFQLAGELSFATVPQVYVQGGELFDSTAAILVLDLGGIERTDSAGLALLVEWLRQARHQRRDLRFRNIPAQLLAIAKASGLENILPLANHS